MMTCKEVASDLSRGIRNQSGPGGLVRRLRLAMHLAMCKACRAFARQLKWMDRSAQQHRDTLERDVPAGFDERIQERLTRRHE